MILAIFDASGAPVQLMRGSSQTCVLTALNLSSGTSAMDVTAMGYIKLSDVPTKGGLPSGAKVITADAS